MKGLKLLNNPSLRAPNEVRGEAISVLGDCFVASLLAMTLCVNSAFCDEQKEEPITCNGDKIEYQDGNKKLIGSGNMEVTYQDMKIQADKVEVNLETKEAYAVGNVIMTQGKNIFKAESVLYNFRDKKGKLLKGRMDAPPWYGQCDKIDKVADKEYILGTGYISTCERIPPHYKIRTKQVKLYLDDRIEAKNVVITAGNVPIMYLPIYTHNVKSKKPMIAVVPGHSKEWGYYNLTALRYNLTQQEQAPLQMHNPMTWTRFVTGQGKLHMDYRSEKGFASGVTHNYNLLGNGIFDVYYINEEDKALAREKQRYRAMLRHKWQIDKKTLALAEYNKLTDSAFTRDYFYRQEYVNEIQPRTYASLLRLEPGYSTGFLYQNRVNSFFTETEYLPQATIDIKNQRLVDKLPFYYKAEYSAANLAKKNANSDIDDDAARLDGYNELSSVFVPIGSLCFNPYIGTRQSWYSKDKAGNEDKTRGIFYSGIDTSTKFYKTYHSLRHIVTPLVRYKYIHQPTTNKDDLANFDDLDTIAQKNILTFSIENDFQTKRYSQMGTKTVVARSPVQYTGSRLREGATKQSPSSEIASPRNFGARNDDLAYDTVDLARFILGTDYNFQRTPGGEFTNITGDLELRPSGKFFIESDASFNPHSQKLDIANIDFVVKESDAKKIGLGHRYQKQESSEMTFDANYPLTKKLGLHCYERYQFYGRNFKEQEYGLSYDLHCWTMDTNFNNSAASGSAIWVIFRLKAFPDFPIQLGSTLYQNPKPETFGGSS